MVLKLFSGITQVLKGANLSVTHLEYLISKSDARTPPQQSTARFDEDIFGMKKVKVRKFEVDAETPVSKWLSKNLSDAKRYVFILKSTQDSKAMDKL